MRGYDAEIPPLLADKPDPIELHPAHVDGYEEMMGKRPELSDLLNELVTDLEELSQDLYHSVLFLRALEHNLSRIENELCSIKARVEAYRKRLQSGMEC